MDHKKTLNLYGQRCTPVVTAVKKQLETMGNGDVLVLNCDNPCALKKIRNFCNVQDYHYEIYKIDSDAMRYIIKVE